MRAKRTAVLLALFFSFFAWRYTYRTDRLKFWAGFTLVVAPASIAAMSYLPGFVSTTTNAEEVSSLYTFSLITLISWCFFLVWALIDAIRRPKAFYSNYSA